MITINPHWNTIQGSRWTWVWALTRHGLQTFSKRKDRVDTKYIFNIQWETSCDISDGGAQAHDEECVWCEVARWNPPSIGASNYAIVIITNPNLNDKQWILRLRK